MSDLAYIIPARLGSKGLPYKNRKLFDFVIRQLPKIEHNKIIVSTNDPEIVVRARKYNVKVHSRSSSNSSDIASMKNVVEEIAQDYNLDKDTDVVLLYLTYPQRKFSDILAAYKFYTQNNATSMLCREEISDHPYLCLEQLEDHQGKQITPHNLYRRQDYPKCFRLSHFVSILKVSELNSLNDNLYNRNTVYYPISTSIDVDTTEDFNKLLSKDKK